MSAALAYYQRGEAAMGDQLIARAFELYPPMAKRVDIFYEWALADQPRGFRGLIESEEIEERAGLLYARVEALNASASPELATMASFATANLNLALSMLADQAGNWALARRYLLRATRANPSFLADPSFTRRLAKLMAGKQIVSYARGRSD
jgi:hypothetical protein